MDIIISPIHETYFAGRIWMGLDYELIKSKLETKYDATVRIIGFHNLKESLNDLPNNTVLFYSSEYNPDYLKFIQDTVHYISLARPDIILIPNKHQLNSLENKGYQELYKDLLGIDKVKGHYFGDIDELLKSGVGFTYPFVLKKNQGALSSGVQLIRSEEELFAYRERVKKKTIKEQLAYKLNKRNSFKKDLNLLPKKELLKENFSNFFSKRMPVVVQEFIPNLDCDYKVLIFGDKYYPFKRQTRENDFRASGSGKFLFIEPPIKVLEFARDLYLKFDVPFISLDIGIDNNDNCYMFEFQGTAFGPIGLTQSKFYLKYINHNWEKFYETPDLEAEYANAVVHYIRKENSYENP